MKKPLVISQECKLLPLSKITTQYNIWLCMAWYTVLIIFFASLLVLEWEIPYLYALPTQQVNLFATLNV